MDTAKWTDQHQRALCGHGVLGALIACWWKVSGLQHLGDSLAWSSPLYDPVVLVTVLLEKFFHHVAPSMFAATVLISPNSPDPCGRENGLKNIYSLSSKIDCGCQGGEGYGRDGLGVWG